MAFWNTFQKPPRLYKVRQISPSCRIVGHSCRSFPRRSRTYSRKCGRTRSSRCASRT
jgi:hypothetical protein